MNDCPAVKLSPRYYGLFKIIAKINDAAYRLDLPSHWHIHNAFHIHLLKPYKGSLPPPPVYDDPPLLDKNEELLEPDSIIDHQHTNTRTGNIYVKYLVTFKNHPVQDAKWFPERFFHSYPSILSSYLSRS